MKPADSTTSYQVNGVTQNKKELHQNTPSSVKFCIFHSKHFQGELSVTGIRNLYMRRKRTANYGIEYRNLKEDIVLTLRVVISRSGSRQIKLEFVGEEGRTNFCEF